MSGRGNPKLGKSAESLILAGHLPKPSSTFTGIRSTCISLKIHKILLLSYQRLPVLQSRSDIINLHHWPCDAPHNHFTETRSLTPEWAKLAGRTIFFPRWHLKQYTSGLPSTLWRHPPLLFLMFSSPSPVLSQLSSSLVPGWANPLTSPSFLIGSSRPAFLNSSSPFCTLAIHYWGFCGWSTTLSPVSSAVIELVNKSLEIKALHHYDLHCGIQYGECLERFVVEGWKWGETGALLTLLLTLI